MLPHGHTEEDRAALDAERRQAEEERAALMEKAAAYKKAAESAGSLAQGLLEGAPPGEEDVPRWLARRFKELGVK